MLTAIGRVCSLRVIGGHFPFLRVKVQRYKGFYLHTNSLQKKCSYHSIPRPGYDSWQNMQKSFDIKHFNILIPCNEARRHITGGRVQGVLKQVSKLCLRYSLGMIYSFLRLTLRLQYYNLVLYIWKCYIHFNLI